MAEPSEHPEPLVESATTLVSASRRELSRLSGTVLEARYELGPILGQGGMGAVFTARHLRLDRVVAIKVLRPALADRHEYGHRFLREAKAASKIRHRNVVEILDYGETTDGLLYSVMEFLEGQDIEALLREQPARRLPWRQARPLLLQVVSGLRAAHARGVIHRDIKPANCVVTREDDAPLVKLVDFGIAKVEDHEDGVALTATAQVIGTPGYIAPELIRALGPADARSDIYSVGVLAYRMLVGRTPFSGTSLFDVLEQSCRASVPSLRARVPEIPELVESFVLELLAKDPRDRPLDMAAVRQRLEELNEESLDTRVFWSGASVERSAHAPIPGPESRVSKSTTALRDEATEARDARRGRVRRRDGNSTAADGPLRPAWTAKATAKSTRRADEPTSGIHADAPRSGQRWAIGAGIVLAGLSLAWIANARTQPASERPRPSPGAGDMSVAGSAAVHTPVIVAEAAPARGERRVHEATAVGSTGAAAEDELTGEGSESGSLAAAPRVVDAPAEPAPASAPASPLPEASPPASRRRAPKKRAARAAQPQIPPDEDVVRILQGKMKSRCDELMGNETIVVNFNIGSDGRTSQVTATSDTDAARCMEDIVRKGVFRKRDMGEVMIMSAKR